MIASELIFKAVPFAYRIQNSRPYALESESNGTFFDSPEYGTKNDDFWPRIEVSGWTKCNCGYSVYVAEIPDGNGKLLVLHGLKIRGAWKSSGRDQNLSIVTDRAKIESYIKDLFYSIRVSNINFKNTVQDKVKSLVDEGIHEIRSMNNSLYHVAVGLANGSEVTPKGRELAKNVAGLAELVSNRIELADIVASDDYNLNNKLRGPVDIFKKFEKVAKCYMAYAFNRGITIYANGKQSTGKTRGISNFEMIPLIVVENAVKYSPDKQKVDIVIFDTPIGTTCEIRSFGPKIEVFEKQKIFEKEFRGSHAKLSGKNGAGIGLYFAKLLLDAIGGEISCDQDEKATLPNIRNGYKTLFTIKFKRYP